MVDIPCVFISFYQKFTDSEILQTLGTRESNPACLKLDKFAHFQFVVLARRQPCFVLRIEILLIFSAFKVEEF